MPIWRNTCALTTATSVIAAANTTQGASDALGLSSTDERTLIQRLVVSGLGSLAMIALMIVVGVFVWLTVIRPRALRRAKRSTSTGQYRAVSRDDMLSMYAPQTPEARTGRLPAS